MHEALQGFHLVKDVGRTDSTAMRTLRITLSYNMKGSSHVEFRPGDGQDLGGLTKSKGGLTRSSGV